MIFDVQFTVSFRREPKPKVEEIPAIGFSVGAEVDAPIDDDNLEE